MNIDEKVFKKTGDKFIDNIIKFTIYNPITVVLISNIIILSSLLISSFAFNNGWFLLSFFTYLIIAICIFVFSDFADKLFIKKLYYIKGVHKSCTHFVYLYENTYTLTNDEIYILINNHNDYIEHLKSFLKHTN